MRGAAIARTRVSLPLPVRRPKQLIVLAVARVTGELAAAALAGGEELEKLVGELIEIVRHAGREHHRTLQAEALPVAGSA